MAERGEYRSISRSLFSGKDFRRLSERCRWVFTVLKMNSGMVGLDTWYEAELHHRLAEETGASLDQVRLALEILEHEGWIRREDNVLWVVGHLEHDPHMLSSNLNHRKSVQRHVAGLPRLAIVKAFVEQNKDWFPKTEAIGMGIGWVFNAIRRPKRSAKRVSETHSDHDKEKEDDKEKDISDSGESELTVVRGGWPAECAAIWDAAFAPIEPGLCGKLLKLTITKYGWPTTKAALERYIKGTPEWKTPRLDVFAKEINRWVRYAGMKTTDDKGDLTEWGLYLDGLDKRKVG